MSESELTNFEKVRRLPWQVAANGFNVIFWVTAAYGSVFVLFLYEMGLEKARIGFLLSLLPFCGISAVFTAPYVARFGFKRVFLLFFAIRKVFAGCLLFSPLVIRWYGADAAFAWVAFAVFGFAMCRAISETAIFPWSQEMIPNNIRGKFSAVTNTVNQLLAMIVMIVCGYFIGRYQGVGKFLWIIAFGIAAGIVGVWCFSFVPGGKPIKTSLSGGSHFLGMIDSVRDANFRRFMVGLSFVTIGAGAIIGFLPLYMKEQIGVASNYVVWLDIGMYGGALLSSFLWGWTSDRFGSKPVMLSGPYLLAPLPLFSFLLPRGSTITIQLAMAIYFLLGIGTTAWALGFARYLFVSAVPAAKKTPYMAVFYAGAGIAGGLGPVLAGLILKYSASLKIDFKYIHIDSYTPFLLFVIVFFVLGIVVLSQVRSDGALPMRKFVNIFLQGSPISAVSSLFRYYRSGDESERVSITEQLGYARNPISNHELIEALDDPSFNVRYEAIIAIAHCKPTPELIDALILVLGGSEPDLSGNAAWAMGRMGDKSAIVPLREMLHSEHSFLRARSARALATLGDTGSIPVFLEMFRHETRPGIRIAYAQSLGKLRYDGAVEEMLAFLDSVDELIIRYEMALAMARILGDEGRFIMLWRQLKTDIQTNAAMELAAMKTLWTPLLKKDSKTLHLMEAASSAFAQGQMEEGAKLTAMFLEVLLNTINSQPLRLILSHCIQRLSSAEVERREYLLLALHAAEIAAKHES